MGRSQPGINPLRIETIMKIEDLKRFCSRTNRLRPELERPFSYGDYTFATNGKIIIRTRRLPEAAEGCAIHPSEKLCLELIENGGTHWLPEDFPQGWESWEDSTNCNNCEGSGTDCFGGQCEYCQDGKVEKTVPVAIKRDKVFACLTTLKLAFTLSNPRIAYRDSVKNFYLKFDGGDGCLLKMSPHNNELNETQLHFKQWRI